MQGIHILEQVASVCEIARRWNASMVASDRGVGVLQGQLMQKELGHDKVIMVQYVSAGGAPLRTLLLRHIPVSKVCCEHAAMKSGVQ